MRNILFKLFVCFVHDFNFICYSLNLSTGTDDDKSCDIESNGKEKWHKQESCFCFYFSEGGRGRRCLFWGIGSQPGIFWIWFDPLIDKDASIYFHIYIIRNLIPRTFQAMWLHSYYFIHRFRLGYIGNKWFLLARRAGCRSFIKASVDSTQAGRSYHTRSLRIHEK